MAAEARPLAVRWLAQMPAAGNHYHFKCTGASGSERRYAETGGGAPRTDTSGRSRKWSSIRRRACGLLAVPSSMTRADAGPLTSNKRAELRGRRRAAPKGVDMQLQYQTDRLHDQTSGYGVAGLFTCSDLVCKLDVAVNEKYGWKIPIEYVYGAPPSSWNGGRPTSGALAREVEREYESVLSMGARPCLAFTNEYVGEKDLDNAVGNGLLDVADRLFDFYYVRVVSPVLEAHIKANHGNARLLPSVIDIDIAGGQGCAEYYEAKLEACGTCILHPLDNCDDSLIARIGPGGVEVLVNEPCLPCGNRAEHYRQIALAQKGECPPGLRERVRQRCPAGTSWDKARRNRPDLCLPLTRVAKLEEMGVRRFKIQGRCDNVYAFFSDLVRYTLRDEYLASQVYSPFCDVIGAWLEERGLTPRLGRRHGPMEGERP